MIVDMKVDAKKAKKGDVLLHDGTQYVQTSLDMLLKPIYDRLKTLESRDIVHAKSLESNNVKIEFLNGKIKKFIKTFKGGK